jgi:hypothetical protein
MVFLGERVDFFGLVSKARSGDRFAFIDEADGRVFMRIGLMA